MAYKEPPEKPVKFCRENYGDAYSRPADFEGFYNDAYGRTQKFKAPYDSGMDKDPIRGDGQEADPTRYGGYKDLTDRVLDAEDADRMFRGKGKRY
jgi:hypothetical protein